MVWKPSDGDTVCQVCGAANIIWFTDDALWNEIMPDDGIVCVTCFAGRVDDAGIRPLAWRVIPDFPRRYKGEAP